MKNGRPLASSRLRPRPKAGGPTSSPFSCCFPENREPIRGEFGNFGGTISRKALAHGFNETGKHAFYLAYTRVQGLELFWYEKIQISRQNNVILQFAGRAKRDIQELAQFRVCRSPAAFRYIGRNRKGGSPHLAGETKHLVPGKNGCDVVHTQGQSMTSLPNLELRIVLQRATSQGNLSLSLYYYTYIYICYLYNSLLLPSHCALKTENCELGAGHAD